MRGKPSIEACDDGVLIRVRVQPKASSNALRVTPDGAIAVRLTAPPVDGAANQLLCEFLATFFDLPKRAVELRRGERSREKTLFVRGVELGAACARIGLSEA